MNLLGNFHSLLTCDKKLADEAISILRKAIPGLSLTSSDVVTSNRVRETTLAHELRLNGRVASVGIVVGDPATDEGPFAGEYWIVIDAGFSLFRRNNELARRIRDVLVEYGAEE